MKKITIVIATYNGQKYLEKQLNSIFQSHNFDKYVNEVIVTDDNSTDDTLKILSKFSFVKILKNKNKGVVNNFFNGIINSKEDYLMFCDQDDVWLPEKIEDAYQNITKLSNTYSDNVPLLHFCDLSIVDENLSVLHDSFMKYHSIKVPERLNFDQLVLNNIAPGCTCIINRNLVKLLIQSRPFFSSIIMHDWWAILLASKIGYISFTNKPLMLYRQHSGNVVGYHGVSLKKKILNFNKSLKEYNDSLDMRLVQYKKLNEFLNSNGYDFTYKMNVLHTLKNECTYKRKLLSVLYYFKYISSGDKK